MKIHLRPLEPDDSELLFKWINDPDLVVLSAPFREVDRESHDKWFERIRSIDDLRIFAIALEDDDATIGYCQLKKIDRTSRNAELQIRIGDGVMHGRGAGTAAVRKLLHYAFGMMELHRVYLQVFATNVRAQRAYLKCGFQIEGVQRQAVRIDGQFVDIIMMAVLSGEQK